MNPLGKILLGASAALTLAVVIAIVWLCLLNAHLRVQLAEAEANTTACQIANDDFRQKAGQQDQAVAALKSEGERHARQAEDALKEAQKTAAAFQADAERLAKQKSSGDDCKATAALFDPYIAGAR